MAKFNINLTGSGGLAGTLSQEVYKDTPEDNLNYTVGDDEMASGIYNPLMRNGYLYPANDSYLDIDMPSISNEWMSSLVDPEVGIVFGNQDDNVYTFDDSFVDGGITYTYDSLDGVKIDTGISFTNYASDLEIYQVNGVKKVFYLAASVTANVGIATTGLTSPDDDWLSTVCSGGAALNGTGLNAFFTKADNGLLYVMDDYEVHSIDGKSTGGTNGTAEMSILTFPEDLFEISDAVDTGGRMYIALNEYSTSHNDMDDKSYNQLYINNCGVYVWNRISSVLSMQNFISVENCQRINRIWVGPEGKIFLMTIGTNGNNQIRVYSGGKFVIVKELPFETKISRRDGLLVAEGMSYWAAIDGYLYCGRMKGTKFSVFKLPQYFSGTQASASGPILAYAGADSFTANSGYRVTRPHLLVAYRESGVDAVIKKYYIYGTDTMTDTNGSDGSGFITTPYNFTANQGDVKTGVKLLPTLSTVHDVVIRCIPTSTGSTTIATVKYYFNNSSTVGSTKTVTLDEASKGYVAHSLNKQNVNSIQIEIEWNTSNTMGDDDFAPYLATVDYSQSTTHTTDRG